MRFARLLLITLLLGSSAGSVFGAETWENGCVPLFENELTREEIAESVGLNYYRERPRGISRKVQTEKKIVTVKKKGEWVEQEKVEYQISYFDPSGKPVRDPEVLAQIDALKIPPAYQDVWISPDFDSHILAIGHDARARPQYRYHPRWTDATADTKFARMEKFGNQIAGMRVKMQVDLRARKITRRKLLAAAAIILETGSIRVGSAKYAVENGSYGLTTLLQSHVKVNGSEISFDFIGKEGIRHTFTLTHPEVAPVFEALLKQPGPRLFEYRDPNGAWRGIQGADVKTYLEELSGGEHFTAKDFRTWQGTTAAAKKLLELGPPSSANDAESKIGQAVAYAASILRNKPATCRENYIDRRILEAYASGTPFTEIAENGLLREERVVLGVLRGLTH